MSLQANTIDNDRKFWKTIKPLFSNKNQMCKKITLVENDKILSTDLEIAECFNDYFTNIKDSIDIEPYSKEVHKQLTIDEIDKYKDHRSIRVMNQHVNSNTLKFSHVSLTEVMK